MQRNNILNPFFISAFVLNLVIIELSFTSLGLRGELFAEVGTNFLYHARYSGFWENILKTDTGYLPLFPRLISLFVHYIFPDYWFPFIVNQITFIVVSLAGASLNLERFKIIFNNRWVTWFFSILYCFHHDYDQFSLVNISYAFVPLVLFVFAKELLKPSDFIDRPGLVIIGLAFLSKAAYLSFFPALLGAFVLAEKFKYKNLKWLSIIGMSCLVIQVAMLVVNRHEGPKTQEASLVQSFGVWLAYCGSMIHQTVFPIIKGAQLINIALWCLAVLSLLFIVWDICRKQSSLAKVIVFSSIVLIGSAVILDKSFGIVFDEPGFGFAGTRFYWDRGKLISHYASFFLVVYFVINSVELKKYFRFVLPYLFIINFSVLANRIFYDRDLYKTEIQSFSHWKRDYPLTLQNEFCIPINPKGWKFCHSGKSGNF